MTATFFTLEELGLHTSAGGRGRLRSARSEEVSVVEINDVATLLELKSEWNEQWAETPRATFSQTLEWLALYDRLCLKANRLRAFCVEAGSEAVGFAVFIERSQAGWVTLSFPRVDCQVLRPVGADLRRIWNAVLQHLVTDLRHRHVLDLHGIVAGDFDVATCARAQRSKICQKQQGSVVRLRLSAPRGGLSRSQEDAERQDLGVAERKLQAHGRVRFVRFRPVLQPSASLDCPAELYEQCLAVALNDEASLLQDGSVLNDEQRHRFLRELLPLTWRHAVADLCLLLVERRPVAFRFHTQTAGRLQTVWTGTDSEFHDLPLGALLLERTLRDSRLRRDQELELTPNATDEVQNGNAVSISRSRVLIGAKASSFDKHQRTTAVN